MTRAEAEPHASAQAFDAAAAGYDASFTHTRLGRWLREAVQAQVGPLFQPGQRVLELGCGTGEDAIWLAQRGVRVMATDVSPAMLAVARSKAAQAGLTHRISFAPLDLAAPNDHPVSASPIWAHRYDGVLSNFGALNCLPDRRHLARVLERHVVPRGRLCLVLMSPLCVWEIAWHLVHAQPRAALRRWRAGDEAHAGGGERTRVWYPSPARLRIEFSPCFRHLSTVGIGILLPPPYLGELVERSVSLFERLAAWDRVLERRAPWRWLGDHYLATFERRAG